MLSKSDLDYFRRGEKENPQFWSRLDISVDFKRCKVLDLGCGHGSMSVHMALKGAKKVIGIDINSKLINFSIENLSRNFSELENCIDFRCCEISQLSEYDFDIMVSKNTFEHISNLEFVLSEMKKRLINGGNMYIGFGPLYNGFNGDHGRTNTLLPWGHLIFPESFIINRLNKADGIGKITRIEDLGLNKLSLENYQKIIMNSGLDINSFKINAGNHPILKTFSILKKLPFLKEYFSYNLYCILKKPINL